MYFITRSNIEEILADPNSQITVVSHVWGDQVDFGGVRITPTGRDPIVTSTTLCRNREKLDALLQLGRDESTGSVFVDCLSINQTDSEEVRFMIGKMSELYEKSDCCFVYLEPPEFVQLKALWNQPQVPTVLEDIPSLCKRLWAELPFEYPLRVWPIQEHILPKKIKYVSGGIGHVLSHAIDFWDLATRYANLADKALKVRSFDEASELRKAIWYFLWSVNPYKMHCFCHMTNSFLHLDLGEADTPERRLVMCLDALNEEKHSTKIQNDRVYAIQSLGSFIVDVDYTEPYSQLLQRLLHYFTSQGVIPPGSIHPAFTRIQAPDTPCWRRTHLCSGERYLRGITPGIKAGSRGNIGLQKLPLFSETKIVTVAMSKVRVESFVELGSDVSLTQPLALISNLLHKAVKQFTSNSHDERYIANDYPAHILSNCACMATYCGLINVMRDTQKATVVEDIAQVREIILRAASRHKDFVSSLRNFIETFTTGRNAGETLGEGWEGYIDAALEQNITNFSLYEHSFAKNTGCVIASGLETLTHKKCGLVYAIFDIDCAHRTHDYYGSQSSITAVPKGRRDHACAASWFLFYVADIDFATNCHSVAQPTRIDIAWNRSPVTLTLGDTC